MVIGDNTDGESSTAIKNQIYLSLVGKLFTVKSFNAEAMKKTLVSFWSLKKNVVVRMVEINLFVFQFFCETDKIRVLNGCPWSFDGKILLLKELKGEEQPSEVNFTHSPFWVRLLDVPFGKQNVNFASTIGERLGGFLEFDDSDPVGWEVFTRVKVNLDIEKPLPRGIKVRVGKNCTKWVGFKYERLGDFCYYCGRIGHTDRDCPHVAVSEEGQEMVYQYGPFMIASPIRRARRSFSVSEKEKRWMENLRSEKTGQGTNSKDKELIRYGPSTVAKKVLFDSPDSMRNSVIVLAESGVVGGGGNDQPKRDKNNSEKGDEKKQVEETQNLEMEAMVRSESDGNCRKNEGKNWKRIARKGTKGPQDGMQLDIEECNVMAGARKRTIEVVEENQTGLEFSGRAGKSRRTSPSELTDSTFKVAGAGDDQSRENQ